MKHGDIETRKCGYPFKLYEYHNANNTWTFSMICGLHNHALSHKLAGYPIVYHLNYENKKLDFEMTMNMVQSKNILATLKRKILKSGINI